jgi:hypothetical protein
LTDLHIPDVSEHQATVDFGKVGPAVILRAHNGRRADSTFHARQAQARAHQIVRGFYIYLVKDRDAATQGREAAAVIGRLQPGEFIAVDLEEGDGDQSARAQAAAAVLDKACGGHAWVYSGEAFDHAHLAHVTGRRLWLAAYRTSPEPKGDLLWQHSDKEPHPGIGPCDCSIYHGTAQQLRNLISPPPKPPATPSWYKRILGLHNPMLHGPDVLHVQQRLIALHFLAAKRSDGKTNADSLYGKDTAAAVAKFRAAKHLHAGNTVDAPTAHALG